MRFNKSKCRVLSLGRNNHMHQYGLGDDLLEKSSAEKDLGGPGGQRVGHEPAVCLCGILGCIKKSGQQVEGSDSLLQ